MKYILFILFSATLTAQTQAERHIDIVTVYERVLEMGYKNEQIYCVLIEAYTRRNDTLKVKYYEKLIDKL